MAGKRVHFVMPESLLERIDEARTVGVSRGEFVRRAVERALAEGDSGSFGRASLAPPAPAEQPRVEVEEIQARIMKASEIPARPRVRPRPFVPPFQRG